VSWQLATYAILVAVLAGGFAWYERSRPSARLLGLVAALAALAAAGRVALTPIPNVTPTTDLTLLSGYALGGAPGFVVGALAALVSNFWLGQGPWTPWQMAAWGLAGIAGALLARATGRRLGRLGLALACGVAGLLYGALLDLSVMVTYGGEQSLDRYLALSARGIPFNVAHALGNAAFAFAAGPALVAVLARFRDRLDFTWRPASAAAAGGALSLAVALALVLSPAQGAPARANAADASSGERTERRAAGVAGARAYLERAQNRDGGFPTTPDGPSSVSITGWVMLGLEASGRNPMDLRRAGRSAVSFLRARGDAIRSTGDLERTILALDGAGVSPRSFAGRDLPAELRRRQSPNGSFQGQVNLTAFAVLALRAVGTSGSSVERPAEWLREVQNGDGGWGFHPGAQSESDSTGAALQALAAAGPRGRALDRGAAYLRRSQRQDGGWPLAFGGPTNAQSTAWAVQGLVAAGSGPGSAPRDALDYLASRQASDGHYRYSAASDQTPVWVTGQALTAVARQAFPIAAVPRAREPGGAVDAPGGNSEAGSSTKSAQREAGARGGDSSHGGARGTEGKGSEGGATRTLSERQSASAPDGYETSSGDEGPAAAPIAAAFALLIAALGGGFLLYRRRLP
jgi:energy-coupling factor transport system substrate-specific component